MKNEFVEMLVLCWNRGSARRSTIIMARTAPCSFMKAYCGKRPLTMSAETGLAYKAHRELRSGGPRFRDSRYSSLGNPDVSGQDLTPSTSTHRHWAC